MLNDLVVKRLDQPDEVREFEKGRFEIVHIAGQVIGRATYQPGWRWSVHIGPEVGQKSCPVDHLGLVVSGRAAVLMDDGREILLTPGDVFAVGPGHDSWVVGDEPYVSLHLLGAEAYAQK
jgi:quercetin dioxygenase-like cupin family protein